MEALDTNILVRFLIRDDAAQGKIVYEKFRMAEQNKDTLYIPILVVLETIWVLESVYAVKREELLNSLANLLLMPILKFESQSAIRDFIAAAHRTNVDLSDILIAHSAKARECEVVLTFDKKAAKFELFNLLS